MWRTWTRLRRIPERVLRMEVLGRREDGRAATHLIEVRLSPACETKEDSFRNTSEESEGCCRAQLEKGGGGMVANLKKEGNKPAKKSRFQSSYTWRLMRRFNLAQTRN